MESNRIERKAGLPAAKVVEHWARSMATAQPVTVADKHGPHPSHTGILNRIEREDGSGLCWNLTFADGLTVFVRLER